MGNLTPEDLKHITSCTYITYIAHIQQFSKYTDRNLASQCGAEENTVWLVCG